MTTLTGPYVDVDGRLRPIIDAEKDAQWHRVFYRADARGFSQADAREIADLGDNAPDDFRFGRWFQRGAAR